MEEEEIDHDELERESAEGSNRRPMTDEELRNAEASSDPAARLHAYSNAKEQLAKLDPTNPNAAPDVAPKGWIPSAGDIARVRNDLLDAKAAGPLGYTPAEYRSLASDPSRGGIITSNGREERAAGLDAVREGQIPGPLSRDPSGHAEFRDANGKEWDVKSFRSGKPNGFDQQKSADKIDDELATRENVIVNTAHMSASDVAKLQSEGLRRGWGSRVVYASSTPNFCPPTPPVK